MWKAIKKFFSGESQQLPPVEWMDSSSNPWGVPVIDVRPITLSMLSVSEHKQHAVNAVSFGGDDGLSFVGQSPPREQSYATNLHFPIDGHLADGVLFSPSEMEHKWAIFYHNQKIICVRSWLREVHLVADVEVFPDHIEIRRIVGSFGEDKDEDEDDQIDHSRIFDYLMRSHCLDTVFPVPLPAGMAADPQAAAMWCMNMFGTRAFYATNEVVDLSLTKPLRTSSLLHIAVARGDTGAIETELSAGSPIDLLARDGRAPLHWALVCADQSILPLLLAHGSDIDVRSDQAETPLMYAVHLGTLEGVKFLVEQGADANALDNRGFTALHRAAELGHFEIAAVLLGAGALPSSEAEGHTPGSLAKSAGHSLIEELLAKY